jgi:hypothetical protein
MISGTRMYSFSEPIRCSRHGIVCHPTGYGECNTPVGHDMIYELYRCPAMGCQTEYGVPTDIRFQHESPETIVFLDLHGDTPVRIPWINVQRWLNWDGSRWVLRSEPTYEGSMK